VTKLPTGTGGIKGFNYTSAVLEQTMDALGLRQRVTADNVANVNTPGFKPSEVTFEEALGQALQADSNSGQASIAATRFPVQVTKNEGARMREDGNGVDIDKEMVTTAKTTIAYNAMTLQWSGLYGRLRMAIREGRR
jgi:flagellar basal-body rod protein FlgB